MSEEIPFTTGPLKDWPLVEEILEDALRRIAQEEDGIELDDAFRREVLDQVMLFYQEPDKSDATIRVALPELSAKDNARVRLCIEDLMSEFRRLLNQRGGELIGQSVVASIEIVRLRRRVRELEGGRGRDA